VAIAILVVLAGIAIWRYLPAVTGVQGARTTASELSATLKDLGPGDLTSDSMADLRAQVARLETQLAPAAALLREDPLVGLARGLGPTRDQVLAADALVTAADDLVEAAGLGLEVGDKVAALREQGDGTDGLITGMVSVIAESTGAVDRMVTLLDDAESALAAMPAGAIGPLLNARDLVADPLARYLPLLRDFRRVDDQLPRILGHDGERRYLLLAQNPAELRPTGGFIGTYGILTLKDGAIASMEFHDVYTLDDQNGMPYQLPPDELQAYLLNRSSWELADANWSPDFPTSAATALRLYTIESGDADIDGVMAITTYALDRLLEVTGPVEVPGSGVTVHPGEVTVSGIANTRPGAAPAGGDRKQFLSDLADEVLRRLFALDASRWVDLAGAAQRIADERLALVWFPDPADQAVVEGSRWAGRVLDGGGDLVAAVDANVAPSSKLSMVVERTSALDIQLADDGSAAHTLRMEWTNPADKPGEPYRTLRDASESGDGLYGLFTRLLVPLESTIDEVTGESLLPVSGVEYEDEVAGRRSYGNYLLIEPGTAWLENRWTTPGMVEPDGDGSRYHLTLQKQPGQIAEPTRVTIRVPDGATITGTTPEMTVDGGSATWQGDLVTDQEFEVRFRR